MWINRIFSIIFLKLLVFHRVSSFHTHDSWSPSQQLEENASKSSDQNVSVIVRQDSAVTPKNNKTSTTDSPGIIGLTAPAGNKSAKNGTKVSISKDSNVAEMQKTTIESNDWLWKVFFWSFLVILLAFGLCVLAYDWHSDWRIHKQSMREDMGSYRYSTLQRKDLDDVIDTCEEDDIDTSETPVDHGNPPILEVNTSIVTPAQLQNGNSWCGNANRTSATDLKQLLELDSDEELIH